MTLASYRDEVRQCQYRDEIRWQTSLPTRIAKKTRKLNTRERAIISDKSKKHRNDPPNPVSVRAVKLNPRPSTDAAAPVPTHKRQIPPQIRPL